jgi:hypothetical protein
MDIARERMKDFPNYYTMFVPNIPDSILPITSFPG